MLDFIRSNLRNELMLLLLSTLLIIFLGVWVGLNSMSNVIDDYANEVDRTVRQSNQVSELNVKFKTQVQEWKNTLIRGKDDEQRKKYWDRFNKNAEDIQSGYKRILTELDSGDVGYKDLQDFANAYPPMIESYRKGYQEFEASGYTISVGDKAVSGIDRAPSKSLSAAVAAMIEDSNKINSLMEERASKAWTTTLSVLVIAAIAGCALFAWFIDTKMLKPLNKVTLASRQIAQGDFTTQIDIKKRDQIGHLADNFELIQNDLSQMLSAILKDLGELRVLTERLFDTFGSVKKGLDEQFIETKKVTDSMGEMASTGEKINSSVGQTSDFVSRSTAQTTQGIEMFENNVNTSQSMLKATNDASEIIINLKKDTDDIGSVVNVINGIAEQTNLLALNAAIEAARAGESGRGFAVVADEVRSLANKTQESTKQISQNISKLQHAADSAVSAMTEGKEKATASVEQIQHSQNFMHELAEVFSEIAKLNADVDQAVNSQKQQNTIVHNGLKEIAALGEHSQQEAKLMEDASKVLAKVLDQIQLATQRFKLKKTS
ncbi:MAG: methyl-accepting chemotaxis protein [Aliiglaciecola sp.]